MTIANACLVVLLFLVCGCGSITSRFRGEREPYAGVKLSADTAKHFNHESELIASVIDVPLSAIVDTLYLPYDLTAGKSHRSNKVAAASLQTGRVGYKD